MTVNVDIARASWSTTVRSYETMTRTGTAAFLEPLLELVKKLAANPLAASFVAGTSHERLGIAGVAFVFPDHPHVTVDQLENGLFLCQLWERPDGKSILERTECSQRDAEAVICDLLNKLQTITSSNGV